MIYIDFITYDIGSTKRYLQLKLSSNYKTTISNDQLLSNDWNIMRLCINTLNDLMIKKGFNNTPEFSYENINFIVPPFAGQICCLHTK